MTDLASIRTSDLLARLRRHYIKPGDALPGGIFVPECGLNGTTGSRADALYVGFTSTSGRILVGHELKVSRADWRHELDQPGKSDTWADQCHAWYVVAPSTSIVQPEELPAGWGLMVVNPRTSTRLAVKVKAQVHTDRRPSWQIVRSIMARQDTLRAQHLTQVQHDALDKARAQAAEEARARAKLTGDRRLTPSEAHRLDLVDRLESALAVTLGAYDWEDDATVSPERLAAALNLCRAASVNLPRYDQERMARTLDTVRDGLTGLEQALAAWNALSGERHR